MVKYNGPIIRLRLVNDMRNITPKRRRNEGSANSNRYTVRIEFPVSYRKQTIGAHSNRYKNPPSSAHVFSRHSPLACPVRMRRATNHFPGKRFLIETLPRIEIPVSDRKQRTGQILIETRTGISATRRNANFRKHLHSPAA